MTLTTQNRTLHEQTIFPPALAAVICILTQASGQTVNLAWNANPEPDIAGYVVQYGTTSRNPSASKDVGKVTSATLTELPIGVLHYATVMAYNDKGLFSSPSAEISFTPAINLPGIVRNAAGVGQPALGNAVDFGLVRVGALGEPHIFTLTNRGNTNLSGLRLEVDAASAGNFHFEGLPALPVAPRNGDFERNLEHWTATGSVSIRQFNSPSRGPKVVYFNAQDTPNNGVLSQRFATIPGESYQLTFDHAVQASNTRQQMLRVRVNGGKQLAGGDFPLNGLSNGTVVWYSRTIDFIADGHSTEVVFQDISAQTMRVDLLLDRVRVVQTSLGAATASPSTAAVTLIPGGSVKFHMSFKPDGDGTRETYLNLVADGLEVPLYEAILQGMGSASYDIWLAQKGLASQPLANADQDGLNDLQEYAFGTDPLKAQTDLVTAATGQQVLRGAPGVRMQPAIQGGFQGLFSRRRDHAAVNLEYFPQFSADLKVWVNATAQPQRIAEDAEMELLAVSAPASLQSKPTMFFRMGVGQGKPPTLNEWLAAHQATGGSFGNPDGDQLNNLQEFAFGTDPKKAQGKTVAVIDGLLASRGAPSVRFYGSPQSRFQGLFARRKSPSGVSYRPQFSADLVTWVDAVDTPVKIADDGEMEIVSVNAPASIGGKPARFFRVGVHP